MRFRSPLLRISALALIAGFQACGSNDSTTTPPPQGAIALSLSPTSATVQQGSSTQVTGTLTRSGGFTGDVGIALLNAPAGVTATITTPPINGSSTAAATLAVASTVAVGSYTLGVQATGTGVKPDTANFTLTVTAASGLSLAGTPAAVSLPQGQAASTGLKATRTGGLSGAISYTSAGAPAGLTISFAPTSVADSIAVTATALPSVAVGNYPIVVTGAAGTVSAQATITVSVTGTVALDFSACAISIRPLWVGTEDGNGSWIHLAGSGDVYRVPLLASGKGAVAIVSQSTIGGVPAYTTAVQYIAQNELASITTCTPVVAGKVIHGSVAGIVGPDAAEIAMGGGTTAFVTGTSLLFQLPSVPAGPQDLTAFKVADAGPAGYRIILRRDQNFADGATMPVLDFGSAEAFAPQSALLTVTGGAFNSYFATGRYLVGPNCIADTMDFSPVPFPSPLTVYGVPAAKQRATDFHNIILVQNSGLADIRTVSQSAHSVENISVAIGAGVGAVTTASLPGSYRRLQATIQLASDYTSASLSYIANNGAAIGQFSVSQSAAWLGATAAVTLTPPDLSAVDGYQAIWAPSATALFDYTVTVSSTPPPTLCAEGAILRTATSGTGNTDIRQR